MLLTKKISSVTINVILIRTLTWKYKMQQTLDSKFQNVMQLYGREMGDDLGDDKHKGIDYDISMAAEADWFVQRV